MPVSHTRCNMYTQSPTDKSGRRKRELNPNFPTHTSDLAHTFQLKPKPFSTPGTSEGSLSYREKDLESLGSPQTTSSKHTDFQVSWKEHTQATSQYCMGARIVLVLKGLPRTCNCSLLGARSAPRHPNRPEWLVRNTAVCLLGALFCPHFYLMKQHFRRYIVTSKPTLIT